MTHTPLNHDAPWGVLFDMDGVLADSEPLHARVWEAVLPEYGIPVAPDWFVPWVGIADEALAAYLCEQYEVPAGAEALLARKRTAYRERIHTDLELFPGVREGLKALSHHPLAVATSSSRQDAESMLGALGIRGHFTHVVAAEDVHARKPAPDPFLTAARQLGMAPERCYAVEDSPAGLASARAAGCTVLGVATSHTEDRLTDAHMLFPTTAAAITWIAARRPTSPAAR